MNIISLGNGIITEERRLIITDIEAKVLKWFKKFIYRSEMKRFY
jgi:hypothetical protein